MEEKKELRKQMLSTRNNMDKIQKQAFDETICKKLSAILTLKKIKVVHTFLPMKDEIDIFPLIDQMLMSNITVITPKALQKRKMQNLLLNSLANMEDGVYGTKHSASHKEYIGEFDLIIIPGLAFDKHFYRLGYGSGYYDTFLSDQSNAIKIGICYPFQLVEKVPTELHDVPLNDLIF